MALPPFADLRPGPHEHFRLHALAAAARILDEAGRTLGSHEEVLEQFPFVAAYLEEIDELGALPPSPDGPSAFDWESAIASWQEQTRAHLPLVALARTAALDFHALTLLVAAGLVEEDGRFGALFEAMQGIPGQQRPTSGLLNAWWRAPVDDGSVRARLRRLRELGLLEVANSEAPRSQWGLHVPTVIWDALRGDLSESPAPFVRHVPADAAVTCEAPVLDDALRPTVARLPALITSGQVDAIIVRGSAHNGRRTLVRWIARALDRGVLEVELTGKAETDRDRLRPAALLSTLLHAMPVLLLDVGPGVTVDLPHLYGSDAPVAVVMGRTGGVGGTAVARAITLTLETPTPTARAIHLRRPLAHPPLALDEFADRLRMTSGNLDRTARLAQAHAALAERKEVNLDDLRLASRTLGRQALDTLATRLPDAGDWSHFASNLDTLAELRILENRCRHRERLGRHVGRALAQSLNCGVRALFRGPSGTGKTLAARLIASAVQKDLYRIDLAAVVNKFIGETEKNLDRIFAVSEDLDVILLFDEGDALLTRRTGVSSSNDRYANLETNFLLQRIESFEGIAFVTTNAGDLIDSAFQRRMDVIVDFRAPESSERWLIWQMHLPAGHGVEDALLREVTARCPLTGGEIRNAVLHASLLALENGGDLRSHHVEAAVQREYRKRGGVCPLRWGTSATAVRG
jgi:hypothetical protein